MCFLKAGAEESAYDKQVNDTGVDVRQKELVELMQNVLLDGAKTGAVSKRPYWVVASMHSEKLRPLFHIHTNTADTWTEMVPTHHCHSTINTRAIVVTKKKSIIGGSQTVPIKVTVACTT